MPRRGSVVSVRSFPILVVILIGTAAAFAAGHTGSRAVLTAAGPQPYAPDEIARGEELARQLCVTCHSVPPPDVLPRSMWRDEIARMHLIMTGKPQPPGAPREATRDIALPPEITAIARYYEGNAPEKLPRPAAWPPLSRKLTFARRTASSVDAETTPAIASVRLVDLEGDDRLEVIATDMRHGMILAGRPYDGTTALREIARTPHPAHIEIIDFDRDGIKDFLVGDLGSFLPSDHDKGAVVWLRGTSGHGYVPLSLDGWPRVSEVRAGDFDRDGKLDLAVAAFGWRKTGELAILRNDTADYSRPSFVRYSGDPRTGSINAAPVDLNRDGHLDLVVLFAQEHESVLAFLSKGPGLGFDVQRLYVAPHPNWGSSRIEVVDLDIDGDLDVILTHGDTFDDEVVKPYHGIQWLENRGRFPFTEHRLADMAGVHGAHAVDLDGDNDLDVVASALLSAPADQTKDLPSLVWLEQVRPGRFTRHTLELGSPYHATLDAGDFDRDGDVDIVVGNFSFERAMDGQIEIWENLRIKRF